MPFCEFLLRSILTIWKWKDDTLFGQMRGLESKKAALALPISQAKSWREEKERASSSSLVEKVFSLSVTELLLLSSVAFAMCVTNCEKITTDLKNGFRNGKPLKTLVIFHLILLSISISIFIVSRLDLKWIRWKIWTFQIYVDCRPVQDAPSVFVVFACLFFFLAACTGIAMSFIRQFWA